MNALWFDRYVLSGILKYCDEFFDCKEKGLSYELGCYFQTRKYEHDGMIEIYKNLHYLKYMIH